MSGKLILINASLLLASLLALAGSGAAMRQDYRELQTGSRLTAGLRQAMQDQRRVAANRIRHVPDACAGIHARQSEGMQLSCRQGVINAILPASAGHERIVLSLITTSDGASWRCQTQNDLRYIPPGCRSRP